MNTLLYKEDTFKIIGICMEVHNQLGKGFSEVVYSDALEIEFIDNNIKYSKEQKFNISYKGNILPHKYRADFIINDTIVLEIKAIHCLTSSHVKQTLNYLAVSKLKIGLLINFGEGSLKYKRVIL
ncbi:NADH:ubiquinone oxidoreductase [Polaribacter filamentus]|uniref:NADH:ubiquinone oxidoreductase n=1 Tax=Polaribacter filamentus TaxID=53483 RepID=A0A2S7KKV0_9FLAO|nr:GxxExxY protein [Polaribacter filamentus]PQB03249.1 NADH:ubiquinone oxidoreductase [Polaribacter filamentus]PQB08784.1 NADH:ubiquinone oxidoreductase [Polaribacter filamentus]